MFSHLLPSASSFSGEVDQLFWLITFIVGFGFIAAELMFFWLMWRFRKRPGVPSTYVTGNEKRLKNWINIPHTLILLFDIVIIIAAVRVWVDIKQTLPPADVTVRVMSQQWAWTFTDPGPDGLLDTPDDVRTTDELHIMTGKTYHFELESKDVLHSFFIPAFRLKQDAIPGRRYTGWFRPTQSGSYDILCAEICGMGHGVMGARLVVEAPEQHAAWLAQHANDGALATLNTAAPPDSASHTPAPAAARAR